MRQVQKKQVEDYVELLNKAHNAIKAALKARKWDGAMELLAQCQEGAILAGNLIEDTQGEEFVTVGLLENYCELVYQLHEKLQQGKYVDSSQAHKSLHRAMTQIKNSVARDIPVRMEAVFLPYKASMWDSLESVWKAADEDPDCDAYVIPIPYYDKNRDGSFGEMHYEGDQYPDYVPITRYDEFDFQSHHPDMIFIHNPYDEYNYVTSVDPFFYCKNLKQFTEKLVYIPYFVLGDIDPEDKNAVEGMRHFCTTSAVIHADKVVVQSEKMRQIYINVMVEEMGEHTRKYWEEKILGIGSPKFDRVLSAQEEEQEIPEEWQRIIKKPDGSRKKIILYNTSVAALLQHEASMLEKMKDVFRVFRENQEEVALLWRPHPLIKATIASMRPGLWEAYEELREEYLAEGWGIYDDTPDVDRAIAISDGYYGDGSSLVQMYQKTGKPVMIQDVDIREYEEE
ncbi:MAG TPA: hypothetical protein DF613_17545 [Lachnospiraceae bacterium]|nr:hypothetical protein [Lachnospiraceae bacterium]